MCSTVHSTGTYNVSQYLFCTTDKTRIVRRQYSHMELVHFKSSAFHESIWILHSNPATYQMQATSYPDFFYIFSRFLRIYVIFVPRTLNLNRLPLFNLSHNFWTIRDRAFIFYMCIPYKRPFHSYQIFWPCDLDHDLWRPTCLKTFTFALTFEQLEVGLSYSTCTFLVMRHFHSYQNFSPMWPWPKPCTYISENLKTEKYSFHR